MTLTGSLLAHPRAAALALAALWAMFSPCRADPGGSETAVRLGMSVFHLVLHGGVHAAQGAKAPAVGVHLLGLRPDSRFRHGYLTMPADSNIPGLLDWAGLRCDGHSITGDVVYVVNHVKHGITIDATIEGTVISGSFSGALRRDRTDPVKLSGPVSGQIEQAREAAGSNRWRPGTDWPCWRGPACSGWGVDSGVPLVDDLNDARLVWKNEEELPGSYGTPQRIQGGYAGPIAVAGRVYQWYPHPTGERYDRKRVQDLLKATRDLHPRWARDIRGWAERAFSLVTDDVVLCVDAATGLTLWRTALRGKGINMTYQGRGLWISSKYNALAVPCFGDGRLFVLGSTGRLYALDPVYGQTLWESHIARRHLLIDDRAATMLETGKINMAGGRLMHCPAYADGVVAVNDDFGDLLGFDGETGRALWRIPDALHATYGTPLRWTHGGRSYFIAAGGGAASEKWTRRIICVEPRTGRLVWDYIDPVPVGNGHGVAMSENYIICGGTGQTVEYVDTGAEGDPSDEAAVRTVEAGTVCYGITPEGIKLAWRQPGYICQGLVAPMIHGGHAYLQSSKGLHTVELATGKLVGFAASRGSNSSFIGCDDRATHGATKLLLATPGPFKLLGKQWNGPLANSVTPVLTDGRMYCRMIDGLACYDLRIPAKSRAPGAPRDEDGRVPGETGTTRLVRRLTARYRTERDYAAAGLLALEPGNQRKLLPELLELLDSGTWTAKRATCDVLAGMGPTNGEWSCAALHRLVLNHVGSRPDSFAALCIRTMRRIDPDSLAPLAGNLVDRLLVADVRSSGAIFHAIAELGADAVSVVPDVGRFAGPERPRQQRLLAVHTLRAVGPGAAPSVPALAQCLKSGDAELTLEALRAVKAVGPAAKATIPLLVEHLGKREDIDLFALIALTLVKFGSEARAAVPAVCAVLESSRSEFLKLTMMSLLEHLRTDAKAALPTVTALQMDPEYHVAMYAMELLPHIAPSAPERVPSLIEGLTSSHRKVARGAARQLAGFGVEAAGAVTALAEALDHPKPMVRREAAATLAALGEHAAAAAEALGRVVVDEDDVLAANAADTLAKIGPAAAPAMSFLVEALTPCPYPGSPPYPPGTSSPRAAEMGEEQRRCRAIRDALQAIGPDRVSTPLADAIVGQHRERALGAAQLIVLLGPEAAAAAPSLRKRLSDRDRLMANAAALALFTVQPGSAHIVVETLNTSLASGDGGVVREAVGTIGSILPKLEEARTRRLAAEGLTPLVNTGSEESRLIVITLLRDLGPDAAAAVTALQQAYMVPALNEAAKAALEQIRPGKAAFEFPQAGEEEDEDEELVLE